ncbi:MAG: UDP-4-amino-4,6-dideoxy-N-acetyl-beta-L-altrosamine transaminase [Candidatus Zixiibacteriota bacterium]|nr:MAG: UDP-4-amino-4,6-dideoxy-N-acetyl-beta-L-altrosamine transaminase [candidate division Zixibacteria bacterium]
MVRLRALSTSLPPPRTASDLEHRVEPGGTFRLSDSQEILKVEETKKKFLSYGRQHVSDEDIEAVTRVLRSDWLTQGPAIAQFEDALAEKVGASHVVACATGTAALHLAMLGLRIGPGDKILTTPNTFLADANCGRYVGADVAFADIETDTGNIAPDAVAAALEADIDRKIKAVIPVHFAGQPCDLPRIHELATEHGAVVVDDGCHALGASYSCDGKSILIGNASHSAMTVFSFHPVKHVAMGEGGAIATNDGDLAERVRTLRNHGMTKSDFTYSDQAASPEGDTNPWYYEMQHLGFNYRVTDIQAALGLSQLDRLRWSIEHRNRLADQYRTLIAGSLPSETVKPLSVRPGVVHAYHLFVVLIDFNRLGVSRASVMKQLREAGVGSQVHYIPVHLQPYYRQHAGTAPGDFPNAERYYEQALSLPMYPDLTAKDCGRVVDTLRACLT